VYVSIEYSCFPRMGNKAGPTFSGDIKTMMLTLPQDLYFIVNRISNFLNLLVFHRDTP